MASIYIPKAVRQRVRKAFGNRCAYCLSHQRYVMGKLEIEHIIPTSLGGSNDESNLCLACRLCNLFKSDQIEAVDPSGAITVPLFNPRTQVWSEHLCWSKDGVFVIGLTSIRRATVEALQLNNGIAVNARRNWVMVGWHPPHDTR